MVRSAELESNVTDAGANYQGIFSNEVVGAESLAERLAKGALPAEDALRYAIEIGTALKVAHRRGVIHGKLSPHAIILTRGGVRILRPAKGVDLDALAYRSPEQVAGHEPDWRSDIFAYGAILYEMVAGRCAFSGERAVLDESILERPPATLLSKSPIHAAMEGVIASCLEKDPARRRQRVQNAVVELKLAGRSLTRLAARGPGREERRLRRGQPAPSRWKRMAASPGAGRSSRPSTSRMKFWRGPSTKSTSAF